MDWPMDDDGNIMWRNIDGFDRLIACPACGSALALADRWAHLRWHEVECPRP